MSTASNGPAGPLEVDESTLELEKVRELVRAVPDYPEPGVLFRDLTPALADAEAFAILTTELAASAGAADLIAGVEARGFLIGAAVALVAGTGVVPVRKAGKLPAVAGSRTYQLEYGTATLELPAGTVEPGARVFVVDDVLATGGTAAAACGLLTDVGAEITGFGTVVELAALRGRERLTGIEVHALLTY